MRNRPMIAALGLAAFFAAPARAQGPGVLVLEGQPIGLLASPEVRTELGLDEAQSKRAVAATDAALAEFRKVGEQAAAMEKATKGASRDTTRRGVTKIAAQYRKDLAAFMKPEQVRKLRRITIERFAWEAFRDPDLRDELKMTPEQREQADKVVEAAQAGMLALIRQMRDAQSRKDANDKAQVLNKKALAEIVALLDADQKRQWEEIRGEPKK